MHVFLKSEITPGGGRPSIYFPMTMLTYWTKQDTCVLMLTKKGATFIM
jgi:hypothetical protein